MEVAVKDILNLKSFNKVEIVAGKNGLNRKINNVYFMEVPDIFNFIENNGLLLTTLYPIANDNEAIEQFILKLVDKKISAVGIKPGRYIEEIPQIIINQANEHEIPILILPNDANLSLLSNGVLELLLDKNNSILEFRDEVHNKLISLLLEGADLNKLVTSLSEIIKAPVILIDERYEMITSSMWEESMISIRRDGKGPFKNFHDFETNFIIQVDEKDYYPNDVLVNPIFASGESLGYIIALHTTLGASSNMMVALEQASLLSAFLFQKEQAIQQKEQNHIDSFVRDLFNSKVKSQIEVILKAKVFKWDLDFPIVLIHIDVLGNKKIGEDIKLKDYEMIEKIIAEKLDIAPQRCKVVYYDDALLCFVSVVFENCRDDRIIKACESVIKYYRNKQKLGISISRKVIHMNEVTSAYEETKSSSKIFKILLKDESFVRKSEEIGVYKLIYNIKDKEILQEFVDEKIGDLLKINDKNMLSMISCLIKNNFNLQKTAKDLFIHYNTLRYRIDKLKEFGIDINNGFDLAEIALAYKIYIFLNIK
jgi:purine catabolism regulator